MFVWLWDDISPLLADPAAAIRKDLCNHHRRAQKRQHHHHSANPTNSLFQIVRERERELPHAAIPLCRNIVKSDSFTPIFVDLNCSLRNTSHAHTQHKGQQRLRSFGVGSVNKTQLPAGADKQHACTHAHTCWPVCAPIINLYQIYSEHSRKCTTDDAAAMQSAVRTMQCKSTILETKRPYYTSSILHICYMNHWYVTF